MADFMQRMRTAIKRDPRSLYQLARDADMGYAILHRIATGQRSNMTVQTAERLADLLGMRLELRRNGGGGG